MRYFIAGGAGFIGSNLVHYLLEKENNCNIIVYDNFVTGKMKFFEDVIKDTRLQIVHGDIKNLEKLSLNMHKSDIVYHLASNADIAKAIENPTVDFWEGTFLTLQILEAMRMNHIKKLVYASGSGVYGDWGEEELDELHAPMTPISPYGASKLAGEAMISSYCYMFDIQARAYRFANVVGPNPTHGVTYIFTEQLLSHPSHIDFLGNGKQNKHYIYVNDIINAIVNYCNFDNGNKFDFYNVSTLDRLTVIQLANIVCETTGIMDVEYRYDSDKPIGWKGDISEVRLNSDKIRKMGWENKFDSSEAVRKTVESILENNEKFFQGEM
jgi:UDP-glucose 4-epimerase